MIRLCTTNDTHDSHDKIHDTTINGRRYTQYDISTRTGTGLYSNKRKVWDKDILAEGPKQVDLLRRSNGDSSVTMRRLTRLDSIRLETWLPRTGRYQSPALTTHVTDYEISLGPNPTLHNILHST